MTTRRGSQYSIQSDGGGLRSENDPTKGKRKSKIPSRIGSIRKVPEIPIISGTELELSRSNSNINQSHSEGSNRHIHEPVQAVLHHVKGQRLGNVATNTSRSDELLAYSQKVIQGGGNSEILQCMESTIIQTSNQKDKGMEQQKGGGKKGRRPSSF
ncbi:hypothetical protein O181_044407 [Austropuccinia psidii MF-1]|uniref:Uncharacterized protein n=1 Tax=Austropuccinia psidii MF-1 TaxID=1389203 RepID=A0A9Q3DRR0_9BASI|nr:hypothetical protein [Austropuccinia psidii MF-1]